MIIHMLREREGNQKYLTGCGLWLTDMDKVTAWHSQETCPVCTSRAIFHIPMTEELLVTKLIDLEDQHKVQRFHFTGKRWGFRWLINGRLIYVYNSQDAISPMIAIHIDPELPSDYPSAQHSAREWIIKHGENFAPDGLPKKASAPVQRAIPTGPHCAKCLKPDEGDLMPDMTDITRQLCMPCLIASNR